MSNWANELRRKWYQETLPKLLPFADVATHDLPLRRLLRLSLFQVSVGMAIVLLNATLNRVMVVELGVPVWLVSTMIALPLVFAPFRALIGHRSDHHKSAFGLRRVPYIWMGSLLQFVGFAFMPFAILLLADVENQYQVLGQVFSAVAFLLVGAGLHTTQTAGLALATDLAPEASRPRVVALLYVTLLVGMGAASLTFGFLLEDFTNTKLVRVIQGAAVLTVLLNLAALWKQEAIDMDRAQSTEERPPFRESWRAFLTGGRASRLLVVTGLGTAAFTMQDILLEPYGGEILGLTVSQTTLLTAIWATGTLAAFGVSASLLKAGRNPSRFAAYGAVIGIVAFGLVLAAGAFNSDLMFRGGAGLIGFGGGLFAVGTLTAAMGLSEGGHSGLALGAWGAVQATSNGVAIFLGGFIRDVVTEFAEAGAFGAAYAGPEIGYSVVYQLEIVLLVMTLIVIVPLALKAYNEDSTDTSKVRLAEMP